ncbi:ATP-binding protein [Sporolactobacillus kofuensis]|uniref:ATP-binding protein n=1 Tax=Sporolactobacillus kofuensis TaxID=269672 RepID=A0ABW1WAR2_9BACL|nr:ATP-binding protein [Sporolactobacillus kofuensis]MCO7177041.1 ATP-binding protein [Sporolactobacillus kofuensis]
MDLTETLPEKIQSSISKSQNVCHKHPHPVIMMHTPAGEFCPECARAIIEKENNELSLNAYRMQRLRKTYGVLEERSLIPDQTLLDATFGNYESTQEEQEDNKNLAIKCFQRLMQGETMNLWLAGVPGAGKSHLAMSILRNMNEKGKSRLMRAVDESNDPEHAGYQCLFIDFDDMLREIRGSYRDINKGDAEQKYVDLLSNVDYLVIDDLGAETGAIGTDKQASDFVHRILRAISTARQDKTTIITTNLTSDQLQKMYDGKVISRFSRNIVQIVFKNTKDHRSSTLEF